LYKIEEVKNRKATIVFTSRADARYLATLLNFWHESGERPTSISELVRLSMETFAELLVINNRTEFVQTQQDAHTIIERSGLMTKKMKTLNQRNLMEAMEAEGMELGSLSKGLDPRGTHAVTVKDRPIAPDDPGKGQILGDLERALAEDSQERIDKAKENTKMFKDSMGIIPEN
jgi:hypothetical protein